jgi:hypothetical protein
MTRVAINGDSVARGVSFIEKMILSLHLNRNFWKCEREYKTNRKEIFTLQKNDCYKYYESRKFVETPE